MHKANKQNINKCNINRVEPRVDIQTFEIIILHIYFGIEYHDKQK